MSPKQPKYIFVTGGVMSGLGKGVASASIAKILQSKGYKVTNIKVDPYLNVDAGTMNPLIHGEVFVTDDGGETDMDIGTYERFLGSNLTKEHNITTGQIYLEVINRERKGDYLGKCVQIIPNITDAIERNIHRLAQKTDVDVLLVECGGTVGDIESLPFLETFRQMRLHDGMENTLFAHVTLAPMLDMVGEQKTKPTQHSVQELRRIGIQPDVIVVRAHMPLTNESRDKISLFANVPLKNVISNPDVRSIYEVPILFDDQELGERVLEKFNLKQKSSYLDGWRKYTDRVRKITETKNIAMVGKYVSTADSYASVEHAIKHAGWDYDINPQIDWIDAERIEQDHGFLKKLSNYDGIVIPGGFGKRGSEGKIAAITYARENDIPFLGLCFGLQLSVIDHARNVCNLVKACSTELDPDTPYPVIDLMPEQKNIEDIGATMRLGSKPAILKEGTKVWELYGRKKEISERHRHRLEVNPDYHETLQRNKLVFSGTSYDGRLVEFIELWDHPYFIATQAHPEFKSRYMEPAPLFDGFIKACLEQ